MSVLFLIPSRDIPFSLPIPHLDKLVHVGLFMVFTILFIQDRLKSSGLKTITTAYILTTLLIVLFFATLVELLQVTMHAGREGDIIDILCDLAGFMFGLLIITMFYRIRSRLL